MPSERNTRSNSNNDLSLDAIRILLNESKKEIIEFLSVKINEINDNVCKLSTRIDQIEDAITILHSIQDKQQKEILELREMAEVKMSFNDIMNEAEERQNRANNIVISGCEEMIDTSTTEEKQNHDLTEVKKILDCLSFQNVNIISCHRIGKQRPSVPRLLKVKLNDKDDKRKILRHSKELSSSPFPNIFINSDLTPFQQQQRRELRKELKDRKSRGEDVIIYKGKVVARTSIKNFQM